MLPNKEKKGELMVRCDCSGGHHDSFIVINHEHASPDNHEIFMSFVEEPQTFWQAMKTWWRQRRMYSSEAFLSLNDVIAIRDECNKIIRKVNANRKDKVGKEEKAC